MSPYQLFLLLAAAALPVALPAQDTDRPGPTDTKAPAAPVTYRSAFRDYQPHGDTAVASWRQTNETVHRLGGHMGHVRGAAPSTSPPSSDVEKPPLPGGHDAHH